MSAPTLIVMVLLPQWLKQHLKSCVIHNPCTKMQVCYLQATYTHLDQMQNTPKFLMLLPLFFLVPKHSEKIWNWRISPCFFNGTMTKLLCNCLLGGWGREKKKNKSKLLELTCSRKQIIYMSTCRNNSHFFRVSTKGFEHSHTLSGVILRCLVCAALPANGNKDDSVSGVVEMSEEMQDQEENIPEFLKGCCSHEKSVQDPERLEAFGESNEACEDSLSLEQQLQKRRRQLQHCPRTSRVPPYSFQGIWQGYSNMGMRHSTSSKSSALDEPPVAPNTSATGRCNALQGQNFSHGCCGLRWLW